MQQIMQLVWNTRAEGAGNKPAPKHIRSYLSPQEQLFFKQYAAILYRYLHIQLLLYFFNLSYKRYFTDFLDITSSPVPPKSTFVRVRAVKNVCFETDDGKERSLLAGQQDYLKRAEVEKLIEQGYLVHCDDE
jgi:hypothetical protein